MHAIRRRKKKRRGSEMCVCDERDAMMDCAEMDMRTSDCTSKRTGDRTSD
eukprot:EW705094.1.p5 GENE.EW705094.1~~EW705094.1.p5  ORF type:complete len:50 (-),score=10.10 EW705094.1:145-294(-)